MMTRRSEVSDHKAVILFLKNAEKGHAKTRLAQGIGIDKAHDAYLHLLDKTRQLCQTLPYTIYLFYSQEIVVDPTWQIDNVERRLQAKGDLGAKMSAAFAEVLNHAKSAVIIGSDCPYIQPSHIHEAFAMLEGHDVVYGPALDGGYYLLGMNQLYTTLFEDITWSTSEVLNQSLDQCKASNLSVTTIESLEDVDEVDSWNRYLNSQK